MRKIATLLLVSILSVALFAQSGNWQNRDKDKKTGHLAFKDGQSVERYDVNKTSNRKAAEYTKATVSDRQKVYNEFLTKKQQPSQISQEQGEIHQIKSKVLEQKNKFQRVENPAILLSKAALLDDMTPKNWMLSLKTSQARTKKQTNRNFAKLNTPQKTEKTYWILFFITNGTAKSVVGFLTSAM